MYLQIFRLHGKHWKQRYIDITNLRSQPWIAESATPTKLRPVAPAFIMKVRNMYKYANPSPINAPYVVFETSSLYTFDDIKQLYPEFLI